MRLLTGMVFLGALASVPLWAEPSESEQIAEMLALRPGSKVADVGAGDGEWSLEIAHQVGDRGRVFATEVGDEQLDEIRSRIEEADLGNVQVIEGSERESGLPAGCCDAILLRLVYHHFTHPQDMMESLSDALAPGGRLVVIDIVPQELWRELEGVPDRGGHGIRPDDLQRELRKLGWRELERRDPWNGDDERFAAVFVRRENRNGG